MCVRFSLCLAAWFLFPLPLRAADFHLHATLGNDANDGRSPERPWKSLARANEVVLGPGDRLLFAAGERWEGQLVPKGGGAMVEGQPVRAQIGKYGEGALPLLEGLGRFSETLRLENTCHWIVRDLAITNRGESPAPFRYGVRLLAQSAEPMRDITLRGLHVRDVNGDLRKSHEGCGIFFENGRRTGGWFDGLIIEHCRLERVDRNGICQRSSGGPRSRGVIIRHNHLEDIGGDGIKLWGTNGGLIEHNLVRKARARCKDAAAGIWPFDSDDTVIQFNEVSHTVGTVDGQGYDADYLCRRTVIQYNISHHNEGGFLLVCAPGNRINEAPVIRYNVSYRDGLDHARVIHFGGHSTNALITHNTIHLGPEQKVPLVLAKDWKKGWAREARVVNNLFLVEGTTRLDIAPQAHIRFENNLLAGKLDGPVPDGIRIMPYPPPLAGPLRGPDAPGGWNAYRPRGPEALPLFPAPAEAGPRDFGGFIFPENQPRPPGAFHATD
jgi:hypothetical protein